MTLAALFVMGWTVLGDPPSAVESGFDLDPCPTSPNCISTTHPHQKRAMKPLPYLGSREESAERLLRILRSFERTKVVSRSPVVLDVEFRSALFRFVDDVRFVFDDDKKEIHFRSASRVGYYDFGANRRRMEAISQKYLQGR